MSAQPTTLLVVTGAFGSKLNAANAGVGFKILDGGINVSGTVIGIVPAMHAIVDFAALCTQLGKWLPYWEGGMAITKYRSSGHRKAWPGEGKPGKACQRKGKPRVAPELPWRTRRFPTAGKISRGWSISCLPGIGK